LPTPKPEIRTAELQQASAQVGQPAPGSTEPIKPHLVKTFSVRAGLTKTVAAMSLLSPEPIAVRSALETGAPAPAVEPRPEPDDNRLPPPPPGARPGVLGVLSAKDMAQPPAQRTVTASVTPMAPAAPAASILEPGPTTMPVADRKPRASGWIIQVGAFEGRDEAREKLADAKSKAGNLLKGAEPYTEIFSRGDKRYYRARFAGLRESAAEQACKELKRNKVACFTTKN
jgi:D-alanyl-D-alanine carboxypeptidase